MGPRFSVPTCHAHMLPGRSPPICTLSFPRGPKTPRRFRRRLAFPASCSSSRSRLLSFSPLGSGFAEVPMVQLPGPRKRRCAEQAAAAAAHVSPPAPEDEWFGDGNAAPLKRVKEAPPSPPPQDMYCGILGKPMPLGLRLRKSPSLVELVQMELSRAKCTAGQSAINNCAHVSPINKETKSRSLAAPGRLKASNFPADFLKIGTWEYMSQYEGDLVAKCYYAKHKLVWEVLVDGLKHKIEIQWAHIIALKAICPGEGDGTLDLVLARPPLFFKETDPQPRKHTLWQATSDFTGGQASLHRRHILQCPSTLLSKNFEKLIQCDQRLNQLTQQPDVILDSLFLEPRSSTFENSNESDVHIPKSTHSASPCVDSKDGVKDLVLQQPGFFAQPMELDNCKTEQRTTGHEAPSEGFLGIAEYLFTDSHCPPVSDEKYLMARVNSLCNLLEKDAAPTNIFMPENNNGRSSAVGGVDLDDFDAELRSCFESEEPRSSPGRKSADCKEPPAISRSDSFTELLKNLPRAESIGQFLLDLEEYP